jgi:hypothetical protein
VPPPYSLDAPPPSPTGVGVGFGASPAPPMPGGVPPMPGQQPGPAGFGGLAPPSGMTSTQDLLNLGNMIDQALLVAAQAIPVGAPELRQAQQFVQLAFAKALQAGAAAMSPTAVGNQFPGGGFGAGLVS